MRRTLYLALALLALSVALCGAGTRAVNGAAERADRLRVSAEQAAIEGNTEGALAYIQTMAEGWRADSRWLELVTSHDALSDVRRGIEDALICLKYGERHEFLRASAALSAALEQLRMAEALRLMNLF